MPHSSPEARAAYLKEYARKNREKLRQRQADWRSAHAEELREYHREYMRERRATQDEPEEAKQRNRERAVAWYAANRERAKLNAKANCQKRRALLGGQTPAWADKAKIKEIYKQALTVSKETGIPHEVDHIVPLRGKKATGLHVEHNLRVVTKFENRAKGCSHNI